MWKLREANSVNAWPKGTFAYAREELRVAVEDLKTEIWNERESLLRWVLAWWVFFASYGVATWAREALTPKHPTRYDSLVGTHYDPTRTRGPWYAPKRPAGFAFWGRRKSWEH